MANGILISGCISRVVSGMDETGVFCTFRVGNVKCRAHDTLAELIVSHQGYPRHTVRVEGPLVSGNTVSVCSVTLID
jgi:hypothetical protein